MATRTKDRIDYSKLRGISDTIKVPGRLKVPGGRIPFPYGHAESNQVLNAVGEAIGRPPPDDPPSIGYDGLEHGRGGDGDDFLSVATDVQPQNLDYITAGSDNVDLPMDRFITSINLITDPYDHSVQVATLVPVQDAADKVISALNINGGQTYFSLNNAQLFLRGLSAMNKVAFRGMLTHEDLATAIAANNLSRQMWTIPFGALSDNDPFDITAGIPAEIEQSLNLAVTFGANNLIGTVAANGTVLPTTDIFVQVQGIQGLPTWYQELAPRPDYQHTHIAAPTNPTIIRPLTGRYLKRCTIVNLAVVAANNEPRNDGNVTDLSWRFTRPRNQPLYDRVRWQIFKNGIAPMGQPQADRDGTVAVLSDSLIGIATIDWRDYTHNPFGMDLHGMQFGDVELRLSMGTTTGSVHVYWEYYDAPDIDAISDAVRNFPVYLPH